MLLIYGTLRRLHGKLTRVREKLIGFAVFLKLVRPLVLSDLRGKPCMEIYDLKILEDGCVQQRLRKIRSKMVVFLTKVTR